MSAPAASAPAAAASSGASASAASSAAVAKRPPASTPLSSKDKKAADDAALRESAAAAALSLIPLSAQPPSSPAQTNVFHFVVHAPPFQLRVNSNALVGVVLEYVRDKSIKGVGAMLAARLKKVTEDLRLLHTEESAFNKRSATQLADMQAKLTQASKAIEAKQMEADEAAAEAASAQASADTSAAATATASPAGPTPVGSSKGRTGSNSSITDVGLSSSKEKEKPSKSSKKSRELVVEEPQRSPEEEALLAATTQLQTFQSDHAQKSALLTREKEALTAEEKQLGLDMQWIKLLSTIGSVVPPPPPPPQPAPASRSATPAVQDTRPSSSVSPDPLLRSPSPPAPIAAASAAVGSAPSAPQSALSPTAAGSLASAKNRKLKSPSSLISPESAAAMAAAAAAQAAMIAAASFCPAPSHATFLGIDLCDEQKQPLNLRARPLISAHTIIKPAASYTLVAVYSQPHAVVTDAAQAALQPNVILVPIQFQPAAQANAAAATGGAMPTPILAK